MKQKFKLKLFITFGILLFTIAFSSCEDEGNIKNIKVKSDDGAYYRWQFIKENKWIEKGHICGKPSPNILTKYDTLIYFYDDKLEIKDSIYAQYLYDSLVWDAGNLAIVIDDAVDEYGCVLTIDIYTISIKLVKEKIIIKQYQKNFL